MFLCIGLLYALFLTLIAYQVNYLFDWNYSFFQILLLEALLLAIVMVLQIFQALDIDCAIGRLNLTPKLSLQQLSASSKSYTKQKLQELKRDERFRVWSRGELPSRVENVLQLEESSQSSQEQTLHEIATRKKIF